MRMVSNRWAPAPTYLQWLVLCLITRLHLTSAQSAISTLQVPDADTLVALNFPPNTQDINFYVSSPSYYSWTAFGFGDTMTNALIFVMYASADGTTVTVSPRVSTGNTEPVWNSEIQITVNDGTTINQNGDMIVNATCHSCLGPLQRLPAWNPINPDATDAPLIFAVGPSNGMSSDALDAGIRRHIGYANTTLNLASARGPGPIAFDSSGNLTASSTTTIPPGALHADSDRTAQTHGILYAVTALAIAPFDSLVASFLGRRWVWLHAVTATGYLAFVLGAMGPGVVVSREHVATQGYRTPHQVLGLLTVAVMGVMWIVGVGVGVVRRGAKRRGEQVSTGWGRVAGVHRWGGRGVWVLLVVNVGVGMKLSENGLALCLAYAGLALGVVVILLPIYFLIWRCLKKKEDKEDGLHELTIYDHH